MTSLSKTRFHHAFTLVETMVTMSIATLVGGMIFLVLNAGMNLYAKNTAVNAAHQQARSGVDQLLANVHGAVSIPQLVMIDTTVNPPVFKPNPTPTPGASPSPGDGAAPGISYQRFEAGPFPVVASAIPSDTSIVLDSGAYVPSATTRLNIPTHNIELDVVSSTGSGQRRYNFATPINSAVTIDAIHKEENPPLSFVTAFMTYRVSYAVVRVNDPNAATFIGELRFYPTNNVANFKVIARNVTSPKPFTVPSIPITGEGKGYLYGGEQNRYVAAIDISTVEAQFTKRGYAAVNMFISSLIPFRCRMTTSQ